MESDDSGDSLFSAAVDARYQIVVALYDSGIVTYSEYIDIRNKLSQVTNTLHENLFAQAIYFLRALDASNERHARAIAALGKVVQTSASLLMAYSPSAEVSDASDDPGDDLGDESCN